MRVALAEDSGLLREALVQLLAEEQVEVSYAARDGAELLAYLATDQPDAVILDVRMRTRTEGLDVAEEIKKCHPDVGVLVLSQYGATAYVIRLMSIPGGVGYLLKDKVDDVTALLGALRQVSRGQRVVDQEFVERLLKQKQDKKLLSTLDSRERAILKLMAEGRSNSGIADALNLAPRTVETYVNRIFPKLGIAGEGHRRVQAVLLWLRGDGFEAPPDHAD